MFPSNLHPFGICHTVPSGGFHSLACASSGEKTARAAHNANIRFIDFRLSLCISASVAGRLTARYLLIRVCPPGGLPSGDADCKPVPHENAPKRSDESPLAWISQTPSLLSFAEVCKRGFCGCEERMRPGLKRACARFADCESADPPLRAMRVLGGVRRHAKRRAHLFSAPRAAQDELKARRRYR